MAKLEGFTKVGVVNYGAKTPYHFAIYDDGYEYAVGDTVILSNSCVPVELVEIISVSEAQERFSKDITAEVIAKIDMSAYKMRVEQRKEKEKLRKELNKRKKEIQQQLDDEYYASKDGSYADLLRQINSIVY